MAQVNMPKAARGLFGSVLWPVSTLLVAGFAFACITSILPQDAIDAGFGQLQTWGQVARYDREHPGLAARLAADADYRRFLITTLSLYALVVPFMAHQLALFAVRRPRTNLAGRDLKKLRLFGLILFLGTFGIALLISDPLDGRRSSVIGPGAAGHAHLVLIFVGLVVWVSAWRAYLMVTGRFPGVAPLERWPTQPWMTRYPTEAAKPR